MQIVSVKPYHFLHILNSILYTFSDPTFFSSDFIKKKKNCLNAHASSTLFLTVKITVFPLKCSKTKQNLIIQHFENINYNMVKIKKRDVGEFFCWIQQCSPFQRCPAASKLSSRWLFWGTLLWYFLISEWPLNCPHDGHFGEPCSGIS